MMYSSEYSERPVWLLGNILVPCTVNIGLGSSPRFGLLYVTARVLDLNSSESIERFSRDVLFTLDGVVI